MGTIAKLCGWDGSAWRKLPVLWGYSDRWSEAQVSLSGTAGIRTLNFTSVAAGEVWVVLAVDAYNLQTDPSAIQFQVSAGGITIRIKRVLTPGIATAIMWTGWLTLKQDDVFKARFEGCLSSDDLYANILGYKMKVGE